MKTVSILSVLFACLLIGCLNKTSTTLAEESGELQSLAYTIYSEKTELFVEFKPLVAGTTSSFAAHFTILGENFLPLTEGKVTVSLVVGENGIRNSADSASSPGIFRLALKPTKSGTGKLIFDIVTRDYIDQIIIENVTIYPDEASALAKQTDADGENEITYLKEQAWKVPFAAELVSIQSFTDVIKTNGEILSAPGDEVLITANVSGSVRLSGNKFFIGAEVAEGTHLFTISGGNISTGTIDGAYKTAKATYEKARSDYERASELVKDNIVSQKDYLETKVAFENAQSDYNTLAKNYSDKGQIISSTMSGFVKNILINEGQFVEAGTPLATISKNKRLLLQVQLSQRYYSKIVSISGANFKTSGSEFIFNTADLNGKIVSYGKSASAETPFIPVFFELDNVGEIIPGSFVEVFLKSSVIPNALVIPVSALMEEQGNFYAYVQTGGESFQKRELTMGAFDGKHVQILSGISAGERVVTKGAYQIKLSSASGELPAHGHEH